MHILLFLSSDVTDTVFATFVETAFVSFVNTLSVKFIFWWCSITESPTKLFRYLLFWQIHVLGLQLQYSMYMQYFLHTDIYHYFIFNLNYMLYYWMLFLQSHEICFSNVSDSLILCYYIKYFNIYAFSLGTHISVRWIISNIKTYITFI